MPPKLDFKLFFIGFNKCGTRSLHQYFLDCGLDSYHGGATGDTHMAVLINVALGEPALRGLAPHDVYLDLGAVQSQFQYLDRDYPGNKFVLNIRDVNRWLVSRLNHLNGRYVEFMNLYYGMNLTWPEWVERWRGEFMAHERAAIEHFRGRDANFLRFDVETDQLTDLISFIGSDCLEPRSELPRVGETEDRHYILDGSRIVKL
jgi:hypothetical protein